MSRVQTAIVTGGNSGLGAACARALAAHRSWHVVIAARGSAASARVARTIRTAIPGASIEVLPLDLGCLADVRQFAALFADAARPPLSALVCNAGIQLASLGPQTADGYEQTFAVNHLGHFLLVNLLLPQLVPSARIVVVTSSAHDPARKTGLPAPRLTEAHRLARPLAHDRLPAGAAARTAYATSKLCNVLFVLELARRLAIAGRGITANAFDPGFMPGTDLSRSLAPPLRLVFRRLLGPLGGAVPGIASPKRSGEALARLVCDPTLAGVSAQYFTPTGTAMPSVEARDPRRAAILWAQSAELVGLTGPA